MMPAPYQLEVALAYPLQRVATDASTYLLQTFGLPAVAQGNGHGHEKHDRDDDDGKCVRV